MKKISVLAILLLSGLAVTALAQGEQTLSDKSRVTDITKPKPAPKPELYELRCRGGWLPGWGGKAARNFSQIAERTTSAGDVIVTLSTELAGQDDRSAGADSGGLSEGRCGWIDRPFTEFYQVKLILFDTPANSQLKQKLHGTPVDTSPTAAERYPDAQTIPNYLKSPSHYWSFFGVVRDGQFQASYHKVWKKPPSPPATYEMKKGIMEPPKKP